MPTIVELPDKTEIEFPDGMDAATMQAEIAKAFPDLATANEPGLLARAGSALSRGMAKFGEAMAVPRLQEEGAPIGTVPRFGEPGTFTRGVSEGVSALVEGATTPEGQRALIAAATPVVGPVVRMAMLAAGAKEAAKLAGEASVTGSPETIGQATVIGGATALGALGETVVARRGAKSIETVVDESIKPSAPASAEAVKATVQELAKPVEPAKPVETAAPEPARPVEPAKPAPVRPEEAAELRADLAAELGPEMAAAQRKPSEPVKPAAEPEAQPVKPAAAEPEFLEKVAFVDEQGTITPQDATVHALAAKVMGGEITPFEWNNRGWITSKGRFVTNADAQIEGLTSRPRAPGTGPVKVTDPDPAPALGATAPGTSVIQRLLDAFVPRKPGTPPPLNLDTATNFPDFSPIPVANATFSRVFGIGRLPVMGWLLDPAARVRLPFQESIQRYFGERYDVSRAEASAIGEVIRGRIDPAFQINTKGEILNVAAPEGKSRFWTDVFELEEASPGTYSFTPEQQAALKVWTDLKAEAQPLLSKYKLSARLDDEPAPFDQMMFDFVKESESAGYAPRVVTDRPGEFARVMSGGSIGAKAFFEKQRMFDTMQEGFEKGVRYETSPESAIATWAERVYKRVADKRLAEDPAIGAIDTATKRAEIIHHFMAKGETLEQSTRIADSVIEQGRVNQPAFMGKFVEPEITAALNRAFPRSDQHIRRKLADVNSALKGIQFGIDLGAPLIQGLPTFLRGFTSPASAKAWGTGTWNMFKALASPQAMANYTRSNIVPIREMAAYGSSVGRLNEMVSGLGRGAPLQRAIELRGRQLSEAGFPVVGKPLELTGRTMSAFARSFETFLDVTKVELWKAYREFTPREQWGDTIRGIESQLLTARMEGIGVRSGQALIERGLLLAASYIRGSVNLVGGALSQPGVSGSIMRKTMGGLLVTAPALFLGFGKAIGMTDKELRDRFNPDNPEFMLWKFKVGDRVVNAGLGGIFRSYARLVGNVAKQLENDPSQWHMPFARWYRAHGGPIVKVAWDTLTGKDFMGEPATVAGTLTSAITPLALQPMRESKPGEERIMPVDMAAGFAGLTSFPQSMGRQFIQERERLAQERFNKPYEQLDVGQQLLLNRDVKRQPVFQPRPDMTAGQREAIFKGDERRRKAIEGQLDPVILERLEVLNVKLPSYEPRLTFRGQSMRLTETQESAYQTFIVEEFNRLLPAIINNTDMDKLDVLTRQEIVNQITSGAKEAARGRLVQLIQETARTAPQP